MGGISAIIGAAALIGFLVFLAGVGMVVVAASQGRPVRGGIVLSVVGLVAGLLLSVVSQGVIVVEPQQVAVIFETVNGRLATPRDEGTHIVVPVLQEATIYDITKQTYEMSSNPNQGDQPGDDAITARTQDGQQIDLDVTVIYQVDPENVNELYRNWQQRFTTDLVVPTVRNIVRNEVARFDARSIYGLQRDTLEEQAEIAVRARLEGEGVILDDLLIRNIDFSQEFITEIEAAASAEQRQERARTEAQTVQIEAEGRAQAQIETARGDAQATLLRAQAEAEALALVSAQIAANPALIQYQYIDELSDNVALALIPSNSPFLFDFESVQNLPEALENFEAPDVAEDLNLDQFIEPDEEEENTSNNTGN
jgi:prohibitin 2